MKCDLNPIFLPLGKGGWLINTKQHHLLSYNDLPGAKHRKETLPTSDKSSLQIQFTTQNLIKFK